MISNNLITMVVKHSSLSTSILAICLLCVSAGAGRPFPRILDGKDVSGGGRYPWVVSVRVNNAHKCVGNIIAKRFILCSAACVSTLNTKSISPSLVTVRVGSINQLAGGEIVQVLNIKIHYRFGSHMHNLAILKLRTPLVWSQKVQSIKFSDENDTVPEGAAVVVAGWGLLKSGATPYKLQEANFSVLSQSQCELQAGYGYDSALCLAHAVNEGTCRGDEGAGCVYNNTLVGVVSFAFGSCGSEYPDIASRVAFFSSWIKRSILINGLN